MKQCHLHPSCGQAAEEGLCALVGPGEPAAGGERDKRRVWGFGTAASPAWLRVGEAAGEQDGPELGLGSRISPVASSVCGARGLSAISLQPAAEECLHRGEVGGKAVVEIRQ